MNRRSLLTLMAALPFASAAQAEGAIAGGRLVRHEAVTSAHVKARNVSVWLPPGYEASDARHPVLYMHDGQNLFDPATANFGEWGVDEHLTRLIASGQVRAPIVVGIWNTDLRLREYVPADLIAASFDMLRPVTKAVGQVQLWDNMWNDEFVKSYRMFDRWGADILPMPVQGEIETASGGRWPALVVALPQGGVATIPTVLP